MEKDLFRFKITLLLLPVIPAIILWWKNHVQIAIVIAAVCWGLLALLLICNLIRMNIDKPVYCFIKTILKYIGIFLSGIALIFTWIFAVFPTGLLSILFKRDRLGLKQTDKNTYWKDVKETEPSYENQY